MSAFPVSPDKEAQLAQRMAALGVSEADIEETFVRSGGHGFHPGGRGPGGFRQHGDDNGPQDPADP